VFGAGRAEVGYDPTRTTSYFNNLVLPVGLRERRELFACWHEAYGRWH